MLLVLGIFAKKNFAALLVTILVVGESIFIFMVPTAEAAKQINLDTGPINYLQANLGEYRMLDFGVLQANWASQYDINSLSAIDLPFPKNTSRISKRTCSLV